MSTLRRQTVQAGEIAIPPMMSRRTAQRQTV